MKILILSQARTGSNYLSWLFKNCDTNFCLISELFCFLQMEKHPSRYVYNLIKDIQSNKHQNLVCKEHFYKFNQHILNKNLKNKFLNIGWYIIGLLRKDLVQAELILIQVASILKILVNGTIKFLKIS
jgi:hypothetical protein